MIGKHGHGFDQRHYHPDGTAPRPYREFAADRGSAVITGAPLQLASALSKISDDMFRIPEKDLRQVEHANAFFIVNAFKKGTATALMSSHPSVEKRIEPLRNMQREMERGTLGR